MTQKPTIDRNGKITCPNCGAEWFDWGEQMMQHGDIEELALWPDGKVTLISKGDFGFIPINVKKLLARVKRK